MSDLIHHPPHYSGSRFGIECIEFTRHMSFVNGNAFKYLFRHLDKGTPRQDLEKGHVYATWTLQYRSPTFVNIDAIGIVVPLFTQHMLPVLTSGEQPEVFWGLASIIFNRMEQTRDHIEAALAVRPV